MPSIRSAQSKKMENPTMSKSDFGGLFDTVETLAVPTAKTRSKVDVPAAILELVKTHKANDTQMVVPMRNAEHLDEVRNVFASAGDILNLSVLVAPVVKNEKDEWVRSADLTKATHIRIRPANRIGAKKSA